MIAARYVVILTISLVLHVDTFLAAGEGEGPCLENRELPANVLYKAENMHGGRGPTLIAGLGNTSQWPPCSSLSIYNLAGETIGRFGCFDPGNIHPSV